MKEKGKKRKVMGKKEGRVEKKGKKGSLEKGQYSISGLSVGTVYPYQWLWSSEGRASLFHTKLRKSRTGPAVFHYCVVPTQQST